MGRKDQFSGISEFLAVADHLSFRAAAAALGVTPGAVSQAVLSLERSIGLPLFQRTTRRVAVTEAGSQLLVQLRPAAAAIHEAIAGAADVRGRPTGLLRLSVPRISLDLVLLPILEEFRRVCPEVAVELDINDSAVDLAEHHFDAGIRIGDRVAKDMVAVPLTRPFRWLVVGSPSYFSTFGKPRVPKDLLQHECIRYRFPGSRAEYRWQFLLKGREYSLSPPGKLIVNDHLFMVALARRGVGLAYTADLVADRELARGDLQAVMAVHLPKKAGLYLYFPRRSQAQPKLRTFIDAVNRLRRPSSWSK